MSYYNRFSSSSLPQKRIRSPSFSDKCCGSVDMISVSSRESDHRMSVCAVSTLSPTSSSVSSAASLMSLDPSTGSPIPLCASPIGSSTSSDPYIASLMSLYATSTASSMSIDACPMPLYIGTATPMSAFSSRSVPSPSELLPAPPMLDVVKDINPTHHPQSTLPAIIKAESPVLRCSSTSSEGLEYITPRPQLACLCHPGSGDDWASIGPAEVS